LIPSPRYFFGRCLFCFISGSLVWAASATAENPPPNIILILVDDLGWSDLECYGDPFFETPHLDQLAQEGMRFTNAYAPAPICSASRASILTGRTPARTHLEFVVKKQGDQPVLQNTQLIQPQYPLDLPLDEITIAETLAAQGYRTGLFGKWHLNEHYKTYLGWSPTHGPTQQGFQDADGDFGAHAYGYRDRKFGDFAPGEFPADAMTEKSIAFLQANRDRPFFLFYSSFYPHEPVHTRCEWLYKKYAAKPEAQGAAGDRAMYGAVVEQMDHYIGQLLKAVDDLDLRKNTLVVFLSDNGSSPVYQYRNALRGGKWELYEGGVRVPMIVRWPNQVAAGSESTVPVQGVDIFPTFASVASAPLPLERSLDGLSLVSLFRGDDSNFPADRNLYWHFPFYHPVTTIVRPHSAIRRGTWKLIYAPEDHSAQLFRIGDDPGEHVDLSTSYPDVLQDLQQSLIDYLHTAGARLPAPNPSYQPQGGFPVRLTH